MRGFLYRPLRILGAKEESDMNRTALTLVIVGALNWLLVGLFNYDAVAAAFGGSSSMVSRTIYVIIGLAGMYSVSILFARRRA